jgi:acyl-CoA synthetase (AMP-forming)/AMP-acid ligase II
MTDNGLNTIGDIIFWGNQDPGHNAIECPGYLPLNYRDLRIQITSVVKTLNSRGFRRNDRIAVITPSGPETAVAIISVMAGFTSVPLNPLNKKEEFSRDFLQLNIKAIVVQKGYETAATAVATSRNIPIIELLPDGGMAGKFELEPVAAARDTTGPEFAAPSDIATLVLTSGTTAAPKIVAFTQKRLCAGTHASVSRYKYNDSDRHLYLVPYYHIMGISGTIINSLLSGGTVICMKDFIPSDFPFLLRTYRPTQYIAVPAMHQGIIRAIKKVSPDELKNNSLRSIRSSSASLPTGVKHELERLLGVPVTENYGMSEAGNISVNIPPRNGSVGMPVVDHLAIMDENGTPLKTGETGEIFVKGETVFSGYENVPEENENAFLNGWFRTGDLGYLDDDGYLFLTGRKKEMINKGGRKIAPAEIDAVLLSHPGVREAMSFGVTDPVLGEDIDAMVVPADAQVTESELRRYLLDRLVQFKVPKRIYFVDEIPRNPAGKPLRYMGTQRYSQK